MNKNNIRSIRFSDEFADLIDRQIGDTFTKKFENLITRCFFELPQREKEIELLDEQITMKREELKKLRNMTAQLRENLYQIRNKANLLEASIDAALSNSK